VGVSSILEHSDRQFFIVFYKEPGKGNVKAYSVITTVDRAC